MGVCKFAYLNGRFITAESAQISPFDRGFLFAQAAYEVTAVYNGQLVDMDGHLSRLAHTLDGIRIPNIWAGGELERLHHELLERNNMREGLIYLQISAGAYGARDFAGPEEIRPTLFMYSDARELIGAAAKNGITAITLPDTRWTRRDMKTTQLLSQALAYHAARDAGADTAWMIEDGHITEAASANAWIVDRDGTLITRDLSSSILAGITRGTVMNLLAEAGVAVEERRFTPHEALQAVEAFTSSAGAIIAPVTHIDGKPIGNGAPGPVTRMVQKAYYARMGADVAAIEWLNAAGA